MQDGTDLQEFYQLLTYNGDVDLLAKLENREYFYIFNRPYGAFNVKHPISPSRKAIVQTQSMKRQIANLTAMTDVPQVAMREVRA